MQKGYLFFPAILNAILCFISIPTGLVFYFTPDNHFTRGTLGYSLIERIRQQVAKTPYTCSIGYAFRFEGSTIEKMYTLADKVLYEEKKQFYIQSGNDNEQDLI